MATIAIPALGALGAALTPWAPSVGWAIGTVVGGALFPQQREPSGKLEDLHVTGSGYGAMIPMVWGRVRLGGNLIWATDLQDSLEGGKGKRRHAYYANLAVLICRGPVVGVRRIWGEDLILYDSGQNPRKPTRHNIRIYVGHQNQVADPLIQAVEGAANTPAYRGRCYVVFERLPVSAWGNRIPSLNFEVDAGPATLADVLGDVMDLVGIGPDLRDLSRVAGIPVAGCILAQQAAARDFLAALLRVYAVDLAEIDERIVALPRGGAVELAVEEGDLGARVWQGPTQDVPAPLEITRSAELEIPSRVDVCYMEAAREYQQAEQRAIRYTKTGVAEARTLKLPLVLTASEARRVAERQLYTEWLERTRYRFALGPRYWRLAPGSIISLPVAGERRRARITAMEIGLFAEARFEAVLDDDEVLAQEAAGAEVPTRPAVGDSVVPTLFTAWSGRELRDEDGLAPGFYVAAGGGAGWRGCGVYYSPDGTTWIACGEISQVVPWGTATSALAEWSDPAAWDTAHAVGVQLQVGSISTVSQTEVDAGLNAAVLGNEIIGFATATAGGGGAYTLSTLRRGRRGTPMSGHAVGERFVLVSPVLPLRVSVPAGLVGQVVQVKCLSPGQVLEDVAAVTVVIAPPNAPYDPAGAADEAAQTANEAAQTADEAAQTASEAAQTASEAAQTANEAAQTVSEAAQTANEAAQTANEATRIANEAAQTANEAATGSRVLVMVLTS